jgi:type I restriction enzyme R subunit
VLETELVKTGAFIAPLSISTAAIVAAQGFARNALIAQAVEVLVAPDDRRREFLRLASNVVKAYKALLPDERAAPYLGPVAAIHTLSDVVKAKLGPADISVITARIAALLDEKIEGVAILTPIVEGDRAEGRVDLSEIDFDKLASMFADTPKTAAAQLREATEKKAAKMAEQNPTRQGLVERLEELVATYNAGSIDVERFFKTLKDFVHQLDQEETRAAREGLSEEELAIFDLLTKPAPALTKAQEVEVKRVSRELFKTLQKLVAGVDWLRGRQSRATVLSEIRFKLNELPEDPYPEQLWLGKVEQVWDFVIQRYAA